MDELNRAAEVLAAADQVALACHLNPDADALGSMLGLAGFLQARGTRTVCSYPNDPLDPPRWTAFLPGAQELVPMSSFPQAPAVMVTCDCASFDRLGGLGPAASRAGELIWIDHHRSNDGLGTIPLIDPAASSSCEIVFRLLSAMGGPIPDGAAACLYAGLVTDTGGVLSHGAIAAREFKLPAVVGTGYATRALKDGQMVTVDGTKGVVTIL